MKTFETLTEEQILELVKLVFTFDIEKIVEIKYQPYDKSMYEDAREEWRVIFHYKDPSSRNNIIMFRIAPTLSIDIDSRLDTDDYQKMLKSLCRLPIRNQYKIFEKFREWNIEPRYEIKK